MRAGTRGDGRAYVGVAEQHAVRCPAHMATAKERGATVAALPARFVRSWFRDHLAAFEELDALGADVFVGGVGAAKLFVVFEPSLARELLHGQAQSLDRPRFIRSMVEQIGATGAFTAVGSGWEISSNRVHDRLHARYHDTVLDEIVSIVREEVDAWPDSETFDAQESLLRLSFRLAVATLFGIRLSVFDGRTDLFLEASDRNAEWQVRRGRRLVAPGYLPVPVNRRMKRDRATVLEVTRALLLESSRLSGSLPAGPGLGLLQNLAIDPTDPQLLEEAYGVLWAATETTGNALAWGAYELSQNPAFADRVAVEGSSLGNGDVGRDALANLSATSRFVQETLRLHPPVWMLARQAVSAITARELRIPKRAVVLVPVHAIHRSERFCTDPLRFDPDRETSSRPLPYGLGPRRCGGAALANLEMRVAIGLMAAARRFEYVGEASPHVKLYLSLRAENGIKVLAVPRAKRQVRSPSFVLVEPAAVSEPSAVLS